MESGRWDFTLEQGSTFHRLITLHVGDENSAVVDLTGFTALMQVREKIQSDVAVIEFSSVGVSPEIVLGDAAGTIEFTVTDEQTAALDFDGPAYYDLELESAGGEVTRWLHGRVGFSREVTRGGS